MSATTSLNFEAGIAGLPPNLASFWGFRSGEGGSHSSRTIMLDELTQLFGAVPEDAPRQDYVDAVVAGNCLAKRTAANRRISLQRLTELYGLDPRLALFRVLRAFWAWHEASRPLLALLLALARDPLLRASARSVIDTPAGHEFGRQAMKDDLLAAAHDRLNEATLDATVRNASSSWTQSGHLRGRGRKIRQRVAATPAAAAYALLLGFALGHGGRSLFGTPWMEVLDAPANALIDLAIQAKTLGLLDLMQSGNLLEVSFARLLTDREQEFVRGAHRKAG